MRIVYRGPKAYTIKLFAGGDEWPFERDVPMDVPEAYGAALLANNPEPWQVASGADVFEVVVDEPTGESKGGDR